MHGRGFSKAEVKKRVEQAASIVGVSALLAKKPESLSMEERLRVALGRALVRQPKAFLLLEPLAAFDVECRAAMRSELLALHQRLQATMVCAVADPVDAAALGDRVAVLHGNELRQVDTPSKLHVEPVDLYVAECIGRPPVNRLRGKVRAAAAGLFFKEAEGGTVELPLPKRPELEAYAGRELILGIRPEAIRFAPGAEKSRPGVFQAVVDTIQSPGGETWFEVQTGAHRLTARAFQNVDRGEAGHRITFEIDLTRLLAFDPETGRRL